jgi:hypothetical protein
MKEGSLFCFVLFCFVTMRFIKPRVFQIILLVSLEKSLTRRGASAWFHNVWTCGVKVLEIVECFFDWIYENKS